MSKKVKTTHQNYYYHLVEEDLYDWDSDLVIVSPEYETEAEAETARSEYCQKHGINPKDTPFTKIHVSRSRLKEE